MRVPTDLRSIFKHAELKKSLRTKSNTVALRRCRQYVVAAEQVSESLRLNHFKAELTGTNPTIQSFDLSGAESIASHQSIRDREKELWNKMFKAADSAASYNESLPTPGVAHQSPRPPYPLQRFHLFNKSTNASH
jgi:hypothetical protein